MPAPTSARTPLPTPPAPNTCRTPPQPEAPRTASTRNPLPMSPLDEHRTVARCAQLVLVGKVGDCPRNCVGTSERDRYAYDYEKQDHPEAQQRVGARPGVSEELCRHERKRSLCLGLREAGPPRSTAACWSATRGLRPLELGSRRGCPARIAASGSERRS